MALTTGCPISAGKNRVHQWKREVMVSCPLCDADASVNEALANLSKLQEIKPSCIHLSDCERLCIIKQQK